MPAHIDAFVREENTQTNEKKNAAPQPGKGVAAMGVMAVVVIVVDLNSKKKRASLLGACLKRNPATMRSILALHIIATSIKQSRNLYFHSKN